MENNTRERERGESEFQFVVMRGEQLKGSEGLTILSVRQSERSGEMERVI